MALITPRNIATSKLTDGSNFLTSSNIPDNTVTSAMLADQRPWVHIDTRTWTSDGSHDGDTYGRFYFRNIFESQYSMIKFYFHWLGNTTDNIDLKARFIDNQTVSGYATTGQYTDNIYYGSHIISTSASSSINSANWTPSTEATLYMNMWSPIQGGLTGELTLQMFNQNPNQAKQSDAFRPYMYGDFVGYRNGSQYDRTIMQFRYNQERTSDSFGGIQFFSTAANSWRQGSTISAYGLRWDA